MVPFFVVCHPLCNCFAGYSENLFDKTSFMFTPAIKPCERKRVIHVSNIENCQWDLSRKNCSSVTCLTVNLICSLPGVLLCCSNCNNWSLLWRIRNLWQERSVPERRRYEWPLQYFYRVWTKELITNLALIFAYLLHEVLGTCKVCFLISW